MGLSGNADILRKSETLFPTLVSCMFHCVERFRLPVYTLHRRDVQRLEEYPYSSYRHFLEGEIPESLRHSWIVQHHAKDKEAIRAMLETEVDMDALQELKKASALVEAPNIEKKPDIEKAGKNADRPPGDQREKPADRQSLPIGLFPAYDRQSVGHFTTWRSWSDQEKWEMSYH